MYSVVLVAVASGFFFILDSSLKASEEKRIDEIVEEARERAQAIRFLSGKNIQ